MKDNVLIEVTDLKKYYIGEDNVALITDAEGRELRFRLLDLLFQFRDLVRQ